MRPTTIDLKTDGIPDALRTERRWALWRYEWQQHDGRKGRWSKIPYQLSGYRARSNDPSTWCAFLDALVAYRKNGYDGLFFALGDGWAGVDLDHCCQQDNLGMHYPIYEVSGSLSRIQKLAAYYEVSPSGTGYKVIGRSTRIGGQIDFAVTPAAFTTWTGPRFFAITGHVEAIGLTGGQDGSEPVDAYGSPTADIVDLIDNWFPAQRLVPTDRPAYIHEGDTRGTENIESRTDDQVVECILVRPQADKFMRLVRGDLSDYGNDHSRADQALVCMLAYWSGDLDQVDRLFRQTGLMRDKWNTDSYRRATLAKAVR
jgi:primase-polymerase (primpol)-like protein